MKTKNKYVGLDVHKVYPPPVAPKATGDTKTVVGPMAVATARCVSTAKFPPISGR